MKSLLKTIFVFFLFVVFMFQQVVVAENVFSPVPYGNSQNTNTVQEISKAEKQFTPKKCFLDIDTHMANIMAPNTDNVGFAVGMLNPINFVVTVALSPVILLFWPIKTLR